MPHAEQLPRLLLEHPDACCPGLHVSQLRTATGYQNDGKKSRKNEKGKEKKLSELQIIRGNFKYKYDKNVTKI